MALDLHVWNGGDDSDGLSWATAFQSIKNATITGAAGGTVIGVADDHTEDAVSSADTVEFPTATPNNPARVLSVNRTSGLYSLPSAPQLTGVGNSVGWFFKGNAIIDGLWARSGYYSSLNAGVGEFLWMKNCRFTTRRLGQSFWNRIGPNNAYQGSQTWLDNIHCDIDPGDFPSGAAAAKLFTANGISDIRIRGLTIENVTSFTTGLILGNRSASYANQCHITMERCDLSTPSGALLYNTEGVHLTIRESQLPVNWTMTDGQSEPNSSVRLLNCSAADPATLPALGVTETETYLGTVRTVLGVYRTGGASDGLQSNPYSWEMIASGSNVVPSWQGLESEPMAVWLDPDAAISGATPVYESVSTQAPPETTGTELATGSGWNGAGWSLQYQVPITAGDRTVTLHLASDVSLTDADFWVQLDHPDQVGGPAIVRAFLAKPGVSVWVDPRLVVT